MINLNLKIDTMETEHILMLSALGFLIMILIAYVVFRWIFSMKRQLWNQREMLVLMAKIAHMQQAINSTELELILRGAVPRSGIGNT
jgi:hypothetical protein